MYCSLLSNCYDLEGADGLDLCRHTLERRTFLCPAKILSCPSLSREILRVARRGPLLLQPNSRRPFLRNTASRWAAGSRSRKSDIFVSRAGKSIQICKANCCLRSHLGMFSGKACGFLISVVLTVVLRRTRSPKNVPLPLLVGHETARLLCRFFPRCSRPDKQKMAH